MAPPDNAGFTGITNPGGPGTTILDSLASSLESEFTQTTGIQTGRGASNRATSSTASETSNTSAAASAAATDSTSGVATSPASITSTTFSTSVTSIASTSLNDLASTTATNAASNTSGAVLVSQSSCNSVSCSSALKAAIAVPIVVAAIAGALLFFFCARKRRNRGPDEAAASEKQPKKPRKKWSRHLRAFSFDAELLMGGRFSSTNSSIRSRDPSVRSGANIAHGAAQSAEPSLHSIDEVAPPYRDAISQAHSPASPTQLRSAAPVTAGGTDLIPRPLSTATAPPPYGSIVGDARAEPLSPVSARDPFADSTPVSPIEDSPFNDPPEDEEARAGDQPAVSRGSSLYQRVSVDDASEAASIRQAQIGRRVSARATDNTGGSSG